MRKEKVILQLLCLVNWLMDNKLIGNFETHMTSVRLKDRVVWTIPLPNTGNWIPSAILTEKNLFARFNKINFYLIPVMWDEAPGPNIQSFWGGYIVIPEENACHWMTILKELNWCSLSYSFCERTTVGGPEELKWVAEGVWTWIISLGAGVLASTSCVHLG